MRGCAFMKIQKTIGFPTQGELIQFIYSAAGVLPRKRGLKDEIDEKDKKSLQKKLSRLAAEKGGMNDNFNELIKQLAYLITGHIPNQKIIITIGEMLFDVLEVYKAVQRDEGTYLDKKETMKWFLNTYITSRVVLSVSKHILRFNVKAVQLQFPNNDWFLPSIQNDRVVYPLEKAMNWVYEICETTQKLFHYPDKSPSAEFDRQEQNLESAENWLNGKNLPSLSVLLANFNFSFDALENCEDPNFKKFISEEKRESIRIVLFVARGSTYIFKEILENYGTQFLTDVSNKYRSYSNYLKEETQEVIADIEAQIRAAQLNSNQTDEVWFEQIPRYFSYLGEKQINFARQFDHDISTNRKLDLSPEQASKLAKLHGNWTVMPIIDYMNQSYPQNVPKGFAEFLLRGLELKNDFGTTIEQIEKFNHDLNQSGLATYLPWISDWIQGAFHYRNGEYQTAFPYFKNSFEAAKYCAGNNQYKLINQFVEVAAKNDKWREFKKGIEWAQYLGIEIRWLRKNEHTQDKLEFVFEIMKSARYGTM